MNVTDIKTARDKAAIEIFRILQVLEQETGMIADSVDLDHDSDGGCNRTKINSVMVRLELDG